MIVDSSAILAIAFAEPEAARFAEAIVRAPVRHISNVNWLETMMVAEGRSGTPGNSGFRCCNWMPYNCTKLRMPGGVSVEAGKWKAGHCSSRDRTSRRPTSTRHPGSRLGLVAEAMAHSFVPCRDSVRHLPLPTPPPRYSPTRRFPAPGSAPRLPAPAPLPRSR